jgi:opacity protein-like surface antigen
MNLVMKKIFLFTLLILAISNGAVFAQMDGKRFISGSLSVGLGSTNPKENPSSNSYGYNIDIGLGKFKTNTRASGWNLSTSLAGGKRSVTATRAPLTVEGINGIGVGVGHFWQYYKHFNEKFGIYGGPQVNLNYNYGKATNVQSDGTVAEIYEVKQNSIALSLGLEAGAYYKLNERWWLLASLGFSQPFAAKYTLENTVKLPDSDQLTRHNFTYGFYPAINFPSVGLGLRYFFKD